MACALACGVSGCATPGAPRGGGGAFAGVVVFVQPRASAVDAAFEGDALPKIRALADQMGIAVRVVDARHGAPAEVGLTPLVIFQNHRGRSIFQGRSTSIERLRTFVRTARFASQEDARLERTDVGLLNLGRCQVVAPVKIAPVTGSPPQPHDDSAFAREAYAAIASGWEALQRVARVETRRTDRAFYMDFNPWRSPDGTLYVSVALFSQFHCKKPVYTNDGRAFVGPWSGRAEVFRRAGAAMERAVLDQIDSTDRGDGFDAIPVRTPVVSWSSLGLALPAEPPNAGAAAKARVDAIGPCPQMWRVVQGAAADEPMVQFRFPAPLSNYAGEATRLRGRLTLGSDGSLRGARGWFEVDPASVTMGEPDLDDAIHGSAFLDVERYPTSRFQIERFEGDDRPPAWGRAQNVTMFGTFQMKGVTVPVAVRTILEPMVDAAGRGQLWLRGTFRIPLSPFDLEGPDGPEPARGALIFAVHVQMEPADDGATGSDHP